MSYEIIIAMTLGVAVTFATSLAKKFYPEGGARFAQFAALSVCFMAAMVVTYVQKYAPPEFLSTLGVAFTTSIAFYEVAVKERD